MPPLILKISHSAEILVVISYYFYLKKTQINSLYI